MRCAIYECRSFSAARRAATRLYAMRRTGDSINIMRMNYVKPRQETSQDGLRDTGIRGAMTRGFSGDFTPTLGNRRKP
jgi:hypothetical protein